jgi:hypothetical protein
MKTMNEKENHNINPATAETALGKGAVNLLIFEQLLGAKRQKLPGNLCGLVCANSTYICFEGHDRFELPDCWEEHYHGPQFCDDLTWVFAAQTAAGQAGLMGPYVEALVKSVCPNWNTLKTSSEVLKFWYALANASSMQRATALATAVKSVNNLEQVVERALQLASPIAQAEGEAKSMAMQPFIEFVRNLQPQRADELLAIMYLGRGDCATFAEMLRIVAGSSFDPTALAQQMAGKVPLTRYLQDGLVKWRAEQRV